MDKQSSSEFRNYADIMLEHMPVGVALFDAQNLHLLSANRLYLTFLDIYLDPRWHDGKVIGHSITEWLPGIETTDIEANFRGVAETGISYRVGKYTLPLPEYGLTYWKWTIDPVRDDEGHIVQLLLTANDVTAHVLARRQAEQAKVSLSQAHESAEAERKRLAVIETVARTARETLDIINVGRAAVDAISANFNPFCVCIYTADPAGSKLRLLHIYLATDMLQTQPIEQEVPYDSIWFMSQAYKHRKPLVIEDLQAAALASVKDSSHPLVTSGVRGYICIPLWFGDHFEGTLVATFGEAIALDGSEVQTLIGCSTHIAAALAHASFHTTIANERARLRTTLDRLPEGILIVEQLDSSISYANNAAAHILGVPLKHLLGIQANRYSYTPAAKDSNGQSSLLPWNFAVIRALCGGLVNSEEMLVTKPDGSKGVILCSSTPLSAESGSATGAIIVFQDITIKKSLEQHKNEFLAIAGHELRTPITTIQGLAEILQMQTEAGQSLDSPRCLRALNSITTQSQLLKRLIQELLDLFRIDAQVDHTQLLLKPALHDLLTVVTEALESQRAITKKHEFHLVLEGLEPTDTLIGCFDKDRITQVLTNLVDNAIKYSPTGGEIEVGLRYSANISGEALIWVKDHGIGIAAKELSHIFERFYRASNLDPAMSGFGLGLYLVKDMVTRHQGRIWTESTEGVGSTFYVLLPLSKSI